MRIVFASLGGMPYFDIVADIVVHGETVSQVARRRVGQGGTAREKTTNGALQAATDLAAFFGYVSGGTGKRRIGNSSDGSRAKINRSLSEE